MASSSIGLSNVKNISVKHDIKLCAVNDPCFFHNDFWKFPAFIYTYFSHLHFQKLQLKTLCKPKSLVCLWIKTLNDCLIHRVQNFGLINSFTSGAACSSALAVSLKMRLYICHSITSVAKLWLCFAVQWSKYKSQLPVERLVAERERWS